MEKNAVVREHTVVEIAEGLIYTKDGRMNYGKSYEGLDEEILKDLGYCEGLTVHSYLMDKYQPGSDWGWDAHVKRVKKRCKAVVVRGSPEISLGGIISLCKDESFADAIIAISAIITEQQREITRLNELVQVGRENEEARKTEQWLRQRKAAQITEGILRAVSAES